MNKTVIKTLKIFAIVILSILALLILIFAFAFFYKSNPKNVKTYETTNPFIYNSQTKLSAHRSGAGIYPEETMMAFKSCVKDYKVDYYEFDLHITKDDYLILLHDDFLDRTSDSQIVFGQKKIRPEEKTLKELKTLNMGANFKDAQNNYPYRNIQDEKILNDLRIITVEEVLDFLTSKGDFNYIIEIKNEGELGKKALDILYKILVQKNLLDKVVFGTFHKEVSDYLDKSYPDFTRGAYISEALDFMFKALFNVKDFSPSYKAIQIPRIFYGTTKIVNYAHSKNIAVEYWTINKQKEMNYLKSIDADLIMTDYPNLFY